MRPAFKSFIIKYGAAPQRSWRRFLFGFVIFITGLSGLLLYSAPDTTWFDSLCIGIMLIGFSLAMYGYLGIFASRFNRLL